MRKFLLSVCGLFLICAARAQGVEISVRNDADEALSYACLYVNGKAVAVTDSLGTGTIPAARLAIGDTLAVTYVGAEPQRAVYNEAMRRKGVWKVCLTEKYRTLTADEITVRADIEQLFRQSIRKFRLLHSPHTVTARFAVKYDGKSAEGRATATHLPGDSSETTYLDRGIYWYHMPLKIHPFSDTASVPSVRLHDWLHMGFHTPALALGIVERGSRYVPGIRYGYLGKRDDCRISGSVIRKSGHRRVVTPCSLSCGSVSTTNASGGSRPARSIPTIAEAGWRPVPPTPSRRSTPARWFSTAWKPSPPKAPLR